MAGDADLELGIHRWDASNYALELRYTQPDSDADVRLARSGTPSLFQFDPNKLREFADDELAYGKYLGEQLFADDNFRSSFEKALVSTQTLKATLRLRLFIGPSATELHGIRWETLRDLEGHPLVMGEQITFSRYLSSGDWQPVLLRPRGALRALAVVANPTDLADYNLAAVDVAGELGRIRAGLGESIPLTELAEPGKATLDGMVTALLDGAAADQPYDILCIVAHGALVLGDTWLWMEDAEGKVARVAGSDLVTRLRELRQRPRLLVLIACQSAGSGEAARTDDDGALAALAPRLAEAGIPAVIGMQGSVTMETIAKFLTPFFTELQRDGQIDRALSVARGLLRDRPDYWMPVLYMRLKSGRIWYVPGFGDEKESFEKWPAIVRSLRRGQCTPIIGTHLSEDLLGSSREIAQSWADTYNFPMAPHEREDLPQVAQYLSVNQDRLFPREELVEYLTGELLRRFGDSALKDMEKASLSELFAGVGKLTRERNPADPYKVLADLPLPIYVTTNAASLLAEALRAAGKDPVVEICRWNEDIEDLPSIYDDEPDYQPTPERPLVYHMFGIFDEPDSLVLTEDDNFDFLIGASSNKELIPIAVREALADTALLFLGFRLDDWSFRVVFRTLMSQQGRSRRSRYAHIAGQVLPEEGRFLEPERAKKYLESYFDDADISIFWGSAADFTRELLKQMSSEGERRGRR
jgi:CHAT domain/SIR2-like domain